MATGRGSGEPDTAEDQGCTEQTQDRQVRSGEGELTAAGLGHGARGPTALVAPITAIAAALALAATATIVALGDRIGSRDKIKKAALAAVVEPPGVVFDRDGNVREGGAS